MSPAAIPRDTTAADGARFDVVVVGGGIQGVFCALEATHRGLKTMLVEAGDYGAGTSFNSLRTVHGGLRYLQRLDVARARRSNAQQQWWFAHFPDLVERRACLMPLDSRRKLRGPAAFRVASALARLSRMKVYGEDLAAPAVKLLAAGDVLERLPGYPADELLGGALWQEGFMPESSRLVIECLRWAISAGASALNYVEFVAARPERPAGMRLELSDRASGNAFSVIAGTVINASGARAEDVARRLGAARSALVVPTLAWNLIIDAKLPGTACVVLTPPRRGAQSYFVQPFHGNTLAGTGHAPIRHSERDAEITPEMIAEMRRDLDAAWPRAGLGSAPVLRVLAGMLPGVRPGQPRLALRPRIVRDSGIGGGPLVHVVGVKFTEAPDVARRALDLVDAASVRRATRRPPAGSGWNFAGGCDAPTSQSLLDLAADESVVYLEDLVERRTNAWCDAATTAQVVRLAGHVLPRSAARTGPMQTDREDIGA